MKSSGKCVLVVEDHPGLRIQLRETLKDAGYEVITAADARSAKNALATVTPDLVCADLVLPEGSGYELCELIRSTPHLSGVPVLVVTGRTLPSDRAFAVEAGANVVLTKPFELNEFLIEVRSLIDDKVDAGPKSEVA